MTVILYVPSLHKPNTNNNSLQVIPEGEVETEYGGFFIHTGDNLMTRKRSVILTEVISIGHLSTRASAEDKKPKKKPKKEKPKVGSELSSDLPDEELDKKEKKHFDTVSNDDCRCFWYRWFKFFCCAVLSCSRTGYTRTPTGSWERYSRTVACIGTTN